MNKLLLKAAVLFCMSLLWSNQAKSQIFFTEAFEGTMEANGLPLGWTESGLATDNLYDVGDDALANSAGYWPVPAHTLFAQSNDDACDCDKSEDRLILPIQDFTLQTGGIELIADIYMDGNYSASGNVEVSVDAGMTWTSISALPAVNGAWQDNSVFSLNAYAGVANVLIAFRFNDQAQWSSGLGVDNVRLNAVAPSLDISVSSSFEEYTSIPKSQVAAMDLSAEISNIGTVDVADAGLTANVYLLPNAVTPVFTGASPTALITAGTSSTLSAGNYTPSGVGNYLIEYISTTTGVDVNVANDTLFYSFSVDDQFYARDNGNVTVALGLGPLTEGVLGSNYTVVNPAILDSVFFFSSFLGQDHIGDTIQVIVNSVTAGVPNLSTIGSSVEYVITDADTSSTGTIFNLPILDGLGNPLALTPGEYFVGLKEFLTTENYSLGMSDAVLTPGTAYASISGAPYVEISTVGFDNMPIIRPQFICTEDITDVQTSCGAYTWIDGNVYTTSNNTATFVVTTGACDSVFTLDLTITPPITATDTQTSCVAFTWIDGNVYTTSNNTATFTISTPGACDTLVTLDLTLNLITDTDVQTACGSFTWIDGNVYTASNDTVTFVIPGACDTLVTLDLTINPIDLTVTNASPMLTSNEAGAAYVWIDCSTNSPIAGETGQSFTPTVDGDYAVIVTTADCSDTSACETVITNGVNEEQLSIGVQPNPTQDNITISFNANSALLTVCDAQGKVIIDGKEIVSNETIGLKELEKGIYFFHLVINDQESVHRVMKN